MTSKPSTPKNCIAFVEVEDRDGDVVERGVHRAPRRSGPLVELHVVALRIAGGTTLRTWPPAGSPYIVGVGARDRRHRPSATVTSAARTRAIISSMSSTQNAKWCTAHLEQLARADP